MYEHTTSSADELLKKKKKKKKNFLIHEKNIQKLAIEMLKVKHEIEPKLM